MPTIHSFSLNFPPKHKVPHFTIKMLSNVILLGSFTTLLTNCKNEKLDGDQNMFFSKQKIYYYRYHQGAQIKDEAILTNNENLFKRHKIGDTTNIASIANQIIWLKFTIDTTLSKDYLLKFLPRYKNVTLYTYDLDSVLQKQTVGLEAPFQTRKFRNNELFLELPAKTLNMYFIKYEFYDDFKIAAFEIQEYNRVINLKHREAVNYTISLTLILLIFLIATFNYFFNQEIRNLFYGLYVLFYGIFLASTYYIWHMITDQIYISHTIYAYYIPFSLSTCFFALYIIFSVSTPRKYWAMQVLYFVLAIKFITILLALLDWSNVHWTNIYFTKIDVLIFAILTFIVADNCVRLKNLVSYWLLIGTMIIFIAQTTHAFYSISFTAYFMNFDIIWFGIGIAIHQRMIETEKIHALNEVISLKNNHNKVLEETVAKRTKLLKRKTEELDQNLQTIAELNNILKDNNITLKENLQAKSLDRVLNKELSLDEFREQFPNKEACLNLLRELKWKEAFECSNCSSVRYFQISKNGTSQRKCLDCNKIHSASADTLFHNVKFDLEKAFYILFLTTSNKKYTLEQISEMIDLRVGTVRSFKKKVEAAMEQKKFAKHKGMTWQDLIL